MMTPPSPPAQTGLQRGSVTVELVLLAPALFAVLLFIVGVGRLADAHGQLVGAARDAARAASQARDPATADAAARHAASGDLTAAAIGCGRLTVTTDTTSFTPGGAVRVTVSCTATLADVAMAGFPGHETLRATAVAPLETYRGVYP